MKKIVIYSKGKLFEQYNNQIKWECIVAIVDKKAGADEESKGIPVILPLLIQHRLIMSIHLAHSTVVKTIKAFLLGDLYTLKRQMNIIMLTIRHQFK